MIFNIVGIHFLFYESPKKFKSQICTDSSEVIFALKNMGLIKVGKNARFNPDFSERRSPSRGSSNPNGKWEAGIHYHEITRYALTEYGEMFWQKVNGNENNLNVEYQSF